MKKSFSLKTISFALILSSLLVVSGFLALAADDGDVLRVRSRKGQDITNMDPAFHLGDEEYNINLAIFSRLMKPESVKHFSFLHFSHSLS